MQSAPTRDLAGVTASMTGGEALAHQLVREGVGHVFGVPGVQLDYLLEVAFRRGQTVLRQSFLA